MRTRKAATVHRSQARTEPSRHAGVISVSHTSDTPVRCNCDTTWFRILGHPYNGEHNDAPERSVSTDYFKTIQAKLIRGRLFTETDDASSKPVIIINQTLAKQFFPNEDPIGKMIGNTDLDPKSMRQIVGIIDDIREGGLDEDIRYAVYYPFTGTEQLHRRRPPTGIPSHSPRSSRSSRIDPQHHAMKPP